MKKRFIFLFVIFFVWSLPDVSTGEEIQKGNIAGLIFNSTDAAAREGAVIMAKNISSGKVYKSTASDVNGIFSIKDLTSGMYLFGITTDEGNYNLDGMVGVRIRNNETAKISVSLATYDERVSEELAKIYKELQKKGEYFVGKITAFDPVTKRTEILLQKGMLRKNDVIHVKGPRGDFIQNIKSLLSDGIRVDFLFPGKKASFKLENDAAVNDSVFLVVKGGILPFFLAPAGEGSVVAASASIVYKALDLDDKPVYVSPHKK